MSDTNNGTIYQGRVKWFNNKTGYGFVTVIDGPQSCDKIGTDIFAHHSAIIVHEEQYKYLVQGEYIEFSISAIDSSADYKFQAIGIRGVKGGMLLCETRNEARANMSQRPRTSQRNGRHRTNQSGDESTMSNDTPTIQDNESVAHTESE